MKSIRSRVVLVVATAALLPVLLMAGWSRWSLNEQRSALHNQERSDAMMLARRQIEEELARHQTVLTRLCNNPTLKAALDHPEPSAATQQAPKTQLESLRRLLGFQALLVSDQTRPAAPKVMHSSGTTRSDGSTLARQALRSRGQTFVVGETTPGSVPASIGHRPRVVFSCPVRVATGNLDLVATRDLPELVRELPSDGRMHIRLLSVESDDPGTETLVSGRAFFTFHNANAKPALRLVAEPPMRSKGELLSPLDKGFILAGALALLFALGVGGTLAWSLSRPLNDLEAAAARVGAGDFESTLGVRSQNEIGRALRAFNRMTVDLKSSREQLRQAERAAAWRDIARRVAHEVRNPLLPIQVSIETMQKTYRAKHPEFGEIFEESTQMILDEVAKLDRMVGEFSDFARLPQPQKAPLDIEALVRHVEALWSHDDRFALEVELTRGFDPFEGDRDQLSDVLTNLMKNAVEAALAHQEHRPPRIRLTAAPASGGVLLAVHDSGPGIAQKERGRVFEPYVTDKAGGTGLGLSIVRRIVSDHGGTISIRESALGGALFEVFLPYLRGSEIGLNDSTLT